MPKCIQATYNIQTILPPVYFALHAVIKCALFADPSPPPPLSENAKGFLTTLEQSGEEELSLHLQDRMLFSKEAIAHLVRVFDRLHSRIDDMCKAIQAAGNHQHNVFI